MSDNTQGEKWTSGRGGKRAGAGRPGSGPVFRASSGLTHDEGVRIDALAQAGGMTRHAWLARAVRRVLAEEWPPFAAEQERRALEAAYRQGRETALALARATDRNDAAMEKLLRHDVDRAPTEQDRALKIEFARGYHDGLKEADGGG